MNLKLYFIVLFTVVVSTTLLLTSGAVAQVNAEKIYRWDGNNFVQVPGYLKQISVGNKDNVWGVNKKVITGFADIFKYDGNNFVQVPGYLKQISVGNKDNVWGVVAPAK